MTDPTIFRFLAPFMYAMNLFWQVLGSIGGILYRTVEVPLEKSDPGLLMLWENMFWYAFSWAELFKPFFVSIKIKLWINDALAGIRLLHAALYMAAFVYYAGCGSTWSDQGDMETANIIFTALMGAFWLLHFLMFYISSRWYQVYDHRNIENRISIAHMDFFNVCVLWAFIMSSILYTEKAYFFNCAVLVIASFLGIFSLLHNFHAFAAEGKAIDITERNPEQSRQKEQWESEFNPRAV